jgi:hypothetical protein
MTYSAVEFTVNVLSIAGLLTLIACAKFNRKEPND